jgi:hypothetical protein
LDLDDDLGFAQLFGEAGVVAEQLVVCILQRIAFGFGAALLRRQGFGAARLRGTPFNRRP